MKSINIKNSTINSMALTIEPIGEEYDMAPGSIIEVGNPLEIDKRGILDIQIEKDRLILFVSEDATISINGIRVNSR